MGTHDKNYTANDEPKTRGFVQFQVQVGQVEPCQAIVNRARIVFDCNPALYTNFTFASMGCNVSSISPVNPIACQDTTQKLPAISNVSVGAPIKQLLSPAAAKLLKDNGYSNFKWYPATHLTAPLTAGTGVDMARPETYVLVASSGLPSCGRRIYYVSVRPTGIATDAPILIEDAPGDCIANLIFFGGKPPYTYAWSPNVVSSANSTAPYSAYLDLAGKPAMTITVTDSSSPNKCSVSFSPLKVKCVIKNPLDPVKRN